MTREQQEAVSIRRCCPPNQRPPAPRVLDAATKLLRAVLPKPPERQRLRPREAPPSVGHTRHV